MPDFFDVSECCVDLRVIFGASRSISSGSSSSASNTLNHGFECTWYNSSFLHVVLGVDTVRMVIPTSCIRVNHDNIVKCCDFIVGLELAIWPSTAPMEREMNFALRDCSIGAFSWHKDVAILSAVEILVVPVDTCIELCLIKSALSTMLFPASIKRVLSITLELSVVETRVKVLDHCVGIIWC